MRRGMSIFVLICVYVYVYRWLQMHAFVYVHISNSLIPYAVLFTHAATEILVKNLRTLRGFDHVALRWDSPQYEPASYEVRYSCKAVGKEVSFISNFTEMLESNATQFLLTNLPQDIRCTLTLIAIYNPASIDTGITVSVSVDPKS